MTDLRFRYFPNPSHKRETTEAGPPRWGPHKSACPEDLAGEDIDHLLRHSESAGDDSDDPSRWAVRRTDTGLQWFRSLLTRRLENGQMEIHGHPFEPGAPKIPPKVLRKLKDKGQITEAEYNRLVKK